MRLTNFLRQRTMTVRMLTVHVKGSLIADKCCDCLFKLQGLKFLTFPYLLTMQLKRFDFDYTTMHRIKLNDRSVWVDELFCHDLIVSRRCLQVLSQQFAFILLCGQSVVRYWHQISGTKGCGSMSLRSPFVDQKEWGPVVILRGWVILLLLFWHAPLGVHSAEYMLRSIHVVISCSRDHVILVITSSRLANGTHF